MFKSGKLLKRYKRFFADIQTDEGPLTIHVPNTGSLLSVLSAGQDCLYTSSTDPKRKLKGTLEALNVNDQWVGINTSRPVPMAIEAFEKKLFSHWSKFDVIGSEVKISERSRVDLVLWRSEDHPRTERPDFRNFADPRSPRFHFVEIKNTTLSRNQVAQFPDAVTERGQKHIEELMHLMQLGHTAEMLFVIQREDVHAFSPASDIDPRYAELLHQAHAKGMIVTPALASVSKNGIHLNGRTLDLT